MTELMRALYEYVQREELPKYRNTAEHREAHQAIVAQQICLTQKYPELFQSIDSLLNAYNLDEALELEAMFEATISLCAQLDRLTTGPY